MIPFEGGWDKRTKGPFYLLNLEGVPLPIGTVKLQGADIIIKESKKANGARLLGIRLHDTNPDGILYFKTETIGFFLALVRHNESIENPPKNRKNGGDYWINYNDSIMEHGLKKANEIHRIKSRSTEVEEQFSLLITMMKKNDN